MMLAYPLCLRRLRAIEESTLYNALADDWVTLPVTSKDIMRLWGSPVVDAYLFWRQGHPAIPSTCHRRGGCSKSILQTILVHLLNMLAQDHWIAQTLVGSGVVDGSCQCLAMRPSCDQKWEQCNISASAILSLSTGIRGTPGLYSSLSLALKQSSTFTSGPPTALQKASPTQNAALSEWRIVHL